MPRKAKTKEHAAAASSPKPELEGKTAEKPNRQLGLSRGKRADRATRPAGRARLALDLGAAASGTPISSGEVFSRPPGGKT